MSFGTETLLAGRSGHQCLYHILISLSESADRYWMESETVEEKHLNEQQSA